MYQITVENNLYEIYGTEAAWEFYRNACEFVDNYAPEFNVFLAIRTNHNYTVIEHHCCADGI